MIELEMISTARRGERQPWKETLARESHLNSTGPQLGSGNHAYRKQCRLLLRLSYLLLPCVAFWAWRIDPTILRILWVSPVRRNP